MRKNYIKILSFVVAVLLGVFMFVYGEFDDSPGGQLLGLFIFSLGLVGLIKHRRKSLS